jgi:membrane dipeptidase
VRNLLLHNSIPTDPNDIGHISLDKARAGNLSAEFFSIWADPETTHDHFAKSTFDMIDSVYEQAERHPDRIMMVFSVDDIERAHKQKKLAALMGIEGGHSIETFTCSATTTGWAFAT